LLGTIRSRSRMLQFGEIPQNQIERHLVKNEGRTIEEARLAAVLCGGSLAAALDFNTSEYLDVRKQALHFVTLLLRRGRFAEASAIAVQVTKDKQFFRLWIESVAALLQDIYYAGLATERVGQRDLLEEMQELSQAVSRSALVRTIDGIRKLKSELLYNVNRQIALEAMFLGLTRNA
jgi:DNA polymerase III gamma/tau subunit